MGTETQKVFGREPSGSLSGLRRKQRVTEFVEATGLSGERQRVVGPHRLWAQEAAHAVFDGEPTSLQGGRHEISVELFERSAVRALRILEEDHALACVDLADEHSAFGGMPGGRDHSVG